MEAPKNETGELLSARPTREKKRVIKFTMDMKLNRKGPKRLYISKGRGTDLKDIPNVAFKLSKRKPDETLQLLHTILFGKKTKVVRIMKKNIGQFSGFRWYENEEKQRAKTKEKIDRCVKEKLFSICELLDIPVSKASITKEQLSARIMEFLECPHATTDILLAEKVKKRKRRHSSSDPSGAEKESKTDTTPSAKVPLIIDEESSSEKAKEEPSKEELQAAIENMLKEVDFSTATLSDIYSKLGEHFNDITIKILKSGC